MSQCTYDLQKAGVAYPRTCAECGLGPCKRYALQEPSIAQRPATPLVSPDAEVETPKHVPIINGTAFMGMRQTSETTKIGDGWAKGSFVRSEDYEALATAYRRLREQLEPVSKKKWKKIEKVFDFAHAAYHFIDGCGVYENGEVKTDKSDFDEVCKFAESMGEGEGHEGLDEAREIFNSLRKTKGK